MKLSKITGMAADVRTFNKSPRLVDSGIDLGLEVELEGLENYNSFPLNHPFWNVVEDGSLRNHGHEFILSYMSKTQYGDTYTPVRGEDFIQALDEWNRWHEQYSSDHSPPKATERTSIHVHIDVRGMDVDEIAKFILLYATFEPTFFKVLNNNREEEVYCMPFFNNFMGKVRASRLVNFSSSKEEVQESLQSSQKYESMNIRSILQRGSVEFRIHHGTTNTEEMLTWVNTLLCLRRAAVDKEIHLIDYPAHASDIGLVNFVGVIFKEYTPLIADYLDEALLLSGVRQAQDILQLTHLEKLDKSFSRMTGGEKAGEDSILHRWANKNSRNVYIT